MSQPRIRVDMETATREELVAEVVRLDAVIGRWSEGWNRIVTANTYAWGDLVTDLEGRIAMLEGLL